MSTALEQALSLVRGFEGCVLDSYPDPASPLGRLLRSKGLRLADYRSQPNWPLLSGNPWTIGWGETGGVSPGDTISQADADRLLDKRVVGFLAAVQDATQAAPRPLADNELAAITSWTYNVGEEAMRKSTLLRLVLAGDFDGAAGEFLKWDKAGGAVLPGLIVRRQTEAAVFRGGVG